MKHGTFESMTAAKDRMHFRVLTAALILTAPALFAVADETTVTAPDAQKQAQQVGSKLPDSDVDSNRMVCRFEKPTGSIIRNRICKTAGQWQDEREHSQKFMQDLQKNTGSTHGG